MHTRASSRVLLLFPVVAAALVGSACSDNDRMRITVGGDVLQPSASVLVDLEPRSIRAVAVPGFACPVVPPRTTSFQIVVRAGGADLRLQEVVFQFVDGSGISGSPIPFAAPELSGLFGAIVIPARTSRLFPFSQPFGCLPAKPRNLAAHVTLVDPRGVPVRSSLIASIE